MIETILCNIDENIKSLYPNAKYWGIARKENNGDEQTVFRYKGWGDNEYVGFDDTHSMNIYHRIISAPETSDLNSGFGNKLMRRSVYNMRLVVFGNMRKINDTDKDINYTIAPNIASIIPNRINKAILDLIGVRAGVVQIRDKIFDRVRVFEDEMQGVEYSLHPETLLFAIDYSVTLDYSSDCVEYVCEPVIPKVTVIDGLNTIELTAPQSYTCSTDCLPVTVTATNSLNDPIGQTTAQSGGTGNIPITNSEIRRSDTSVITSVPATEPATIQDSVVRVQYANGDFIKNVNVLAATNPTIDVPNPPVCQDGTAVLTDQFGNSLGSINIASGAIENETVTLPCASFSSFINQNGNTFSSLKPFGTIAGSSGSAIVNNGLIYVTSGNNVDIYTESNYNILSTIAGFSGAAEIAFSPDGSEYAVVNFGNNTIRRMDTATNTQIAVWACVTGPWNICYNALGTEIYVGSYNAGGSITRYNLAGVSQGNVVGFDAIITEIRRVGNFYYVLTNTGTAAASTQRVRVMDFATNTQVANYPLGAVSVIGRVQSMVIESSLAYVIAQKGSNTSFSLFLYEYDLTFVMQRDGNTGLNGSNAWGLAYSDNYCGSLVVPLTSQGILINIKI